MTVWQLGVLLYEMLTGNVPFQTSAEVIFKKLPRIKSDISKSVATRPVFPRVVLVSHQLSREKINLTRDTICPVFWGKMQTPHLITFVV
jgi:serine/threonine protein kinase